MTIFQFGIAPPDETNTLARWGARAIFTRCVIDIPPDRKQISEDAPPAFIKWLGGPFNKWLFSHCYGVAKKPARLENDVVKDFEDGQFRAQIRASGGYLYVGAWMLDQAEPEKAAP